MFYQILRDLLTGGVHTYTFEDAKERIDYGVANGKLTAAEAANLLEIAAKHATTAPLAERVDGLGKRMGELEEQSMTAMEAVAGVYEMMIGGMVHE